jgi:hypothetical protein
MANDNQEKNASAGRGSRDPTIFVLLRELSEVHLLLDNVSANSNKTISETAAVKRPDELPANWIERVCEISWPPDGSRDEKADDAALLIRAKDYLNRLSEPASGASIAFTLLVTQGPSKKGWWQRRRAEGESHTRHSLAETAYPDLIAKSTGFRRVMSWISIGLVVALIFTCALSWYVAYGNAALAEYAAARTAVAEAQTKVNEAEAPPLRAPPPPAGRPANAAASTAQGTSQPAGAAAAPLPAVVQPDARPPLLNYCAPPYTSATQVQLCAERGRARHTLDLAERRLASWTCWRPYRDCDGEGAHEPGTLDVPAHSAALANILGTAVLPFLYGLLGAGAAIIRSLSRKIRTSRLSPRDLLLSFQQLALGAVVGACIGLFIAGPGTDASGDNLLGPVALSASAISFIAGFGVDTVFEAIEQLIRRIFLPANNPDSGQPRD